MMEAKSCQPWWCSDQEIGTPLDLYGELNTEFRFDLDVSASGKNFKAPIYYTKEMDGLLQPWYGSVFCNPPYGKIQPWVDKGMMERNNCKVIVYLLPSRTSRPWFRTLYKEGEVRFLDHRIRFEGTKAKAQFDCLIGILRSSSNQENNVIL